ncbi:hypothetical protein SAMN02910298_01742 [Pseudobutyrivibrio sp. YE44]|uniref:hypothetical protein n=1 Tax=Pseudobutyrivibrio sp. YE44 TaxID=1520802 RepID=UPI0008922550|nr:hypothetical protein [Pseudobutyrivibrio sp. YE44]SDB35365.1 hypothetical protein SAMN02910298_01742 [Pseudobutyrivibrio sp. YE44]
MKNLFLRRIFACAVLVLAVTVIGEELRTVHAQVKGDSEATEEKLIYMGGVYVIDKDVDLDIAIFRTADGSKFVEFEKDGIAFAGNYRIEGTEIIDGVEFTKVNVDGHEVGYHFQIDTNDSGSYVVDEDGIVYVANELSRQAAMDMML